jgi:hypothetical protein
MAISNWIDIGKILEEISKALINIIDSVDKAYDVARRIGDNTKARKLRENVRSLFPGIVSTNTVK